MYRIKIDTKSYGAKPSQYEIPKISNRLSQQAAACVEWNEFCDLVGNKGHSFCVCDFMGSIKNHYHTFRSQSSLKYVDFFAIRKLQLKICNFLIDKKVRVF